MLAQCFEVYPSYGRAPDAADSIVKLFMLVLSDFDIGRIKEAFKFHLANYTQFPVPADIAHIILRGNKPPFSQPVYIALCKKDPESRDHDEWAYIRDYEDYMKTGRY